jgi:hypothetical protein
MEIEIGVEIDSQASGGRAPRAAPPRLAFPVNLA